MDRKYTIIIVMGNKILPLHLEDCLNLDHKVLVFQMFSKHHSNTYFQFEIGCKACRKIEDLIGSSVFCCNQ